MKKFLKKIKKKFTKVALTVISSVTLATASLYSVAAKKVDLAEGVKKASNGVISQLKSVFAIVFSIAAVVALAFTIFKFISAMIHYHKGEDVNWLPTILGFIATIVCGVFSGTAAFGWFGV